MANQRDQVRVWIGVRAKKKLLIFIILSFCLVFGAPS